MITVVVLQNFSMDIDWDVPEITSAAFAWMGKIEESAVSDHAISDKAVTMGSCINLQSAQAKSIM